MNGTRTSNMAKGATAADWRRDLHSGSLLRGCLLGAVAFLAACIAHEGFGHAGTCLLLRGQILAMSSAVFQCAPGSVWVDVAGPMANCLAFLIGSIFVARTDRRSPSRDLLSLFVAFNACWGFGYLMYSAVTDTGDWAFALHAVAPIGWKNAAMRAVCGVSGVVLYVSALRWMRTRLPASWELLAAYVGAGICSLILVLLTDGLSVAPVIEAVNESWGALTGIGVLAVRGRVARDQKLRGRHAA